MTKELVPIEEGQFAIMSKDMDIKNEIQVNLGSDGISMFDLPRITVPTGGGLHWSIPDIEEEGGERAEKSIQGIIILTQTTRQLWEKSFEESSGEPPMCSSADGVVGNGEPGGECMSCEFNDFGTHEDGRRKACTENRLIFIVTENDILPQMVVAPPTSLKNVRKYLVGLTSKRRPVYSVYSKLGLEKDKSEETGITYSKITIQKIGDVEFPDVAKAYAEAIRPYLQSSADRFSRAPMPEEVVPEQETS